MRLDKYLSQSSVGTRKKVHGIIADGHIAVNGIIIKDATSNVDENSDVVTCDDKQVCYIGSVCYMFNKPRGCITARSDDNTTTVLSYFNEIDTEGLFIIGRLDKDTEGLLLLTNDGALDHRLMNPDCHVNKTYFFWAVGRLTLCDIDKLESGIEIYGCGKSSRICKPARLTLINQGMYSEFADEIPIKLHEDNVVSGLLTISEGQKHQVKRMLRAVGCRIFQLKRISIGNLKLDESLKPGEYRIMTKEEINEI